MSDPTTEKLQARIAELEAKKSELERSRFEMTQRIEKLTKEENDLIDRNIELGELLEWAISRASDTFEHGIGNPRSADLFSAEDRAHYYRIRKLLSLD